MRVYIFIFICMMFMHIYDYYSLGGMVVAFKQNKWWQEKFPKKSHRYDYFAASVLYSFRWTFMFLLPPTAYAYSMGTSFNQYLKAYLALFAANWYIHIRLDDLKNDGIIDNLKLDALMQMVPIITTCMVLFPYMYQIFSK